MYDLIV